MPDSRNYYVLCEDNCRFESMTKEQIIAAIAEATGATPTQIDDAFITKIKESNHNAALTFWRGTEAEFNALSVSAPAYKIGIDSNGKIYLTPQGSIPVSAHAASHAANGTDPITAESISAFPQGAFQGDANDIPNGISICVINNNSPEGVSGAAVVLCAIFQTYRWQLYYDIVYETLWTRRYAQSTWSTWKQVTLT